MSKHLVIHPQIGTDASLATCAANDQGKFAELSDAIWKTAWSDEGGRPRLNRDALSAEALTKLAAERGLDVQRFKAAMTGTACKTKLARQRQEWRTLGVNGTPAVFINGKVYAGPRTAEGLSAAIDAELKQVDAALAKGAKVEDYYASLVKRGKKTP